MSQPESSACLSSGKRTFSSEVSGDSAAPTFAMSGTSFARSSAKNLSQNSCVMPSS